jgi:hypothetical protein
VKNALRAVGGNTVSLLVTEKTGQLGGRLRTNRDYYYYYYYEYYYYCNCNWVDAGGNSSVYIYTQTAHRIQRTKHTQ